MRNAMKIIQSVVLGLACVYIFFASFALFRHRKKIREERGSYLLYGLISVLAMFFGTFGVSDTAISVFGYRAAGIVKDDVLPGTIITAAVLPVCAMALSYTSLFPVEAGLLVGCVVFETAGAVIGSALVSRLSGRKISMVIGIAMLATAAMIIVKLLINGMEGGTLYELAGWKRYLAFISFFFLGALNMAGIGATVPAIALLMVLGMDLRSIYPVVMTGNAVSSTFGGLAFLKTEKYNGKAVLASVFGTVAVVFAVRLVRNINVTVLQIAMVGLMIYSAVSVFKKQEGEKKKTSGMP